MLSTTIRPTPRNPKSPKLHRSASTSLNAHKHAKEQGGNECREACTHYLTFGSIRNRSRGAALVVVADNKFVVVGLSVGLEDRAVRLLFSGPISVG